MKRFFKYYLIIIFLSGFYNVLAQSDIEAGKTIFNNRCASCHAVGKKLIGPALQNVSERHSVDWIVDFVRHSQKIIQSGDKTAISLYEEYNKTLMPDHLDLKETDIQNILSFINEETVKLANAPSGPVVPDLYKPYKGESSLWHQIVYLDITGNHKPITKNDTRFWVALSIVISLIVLLLYFIVKGNEFIEKLDEKLSRKFKEKKD